MWDFRLTYGVHPSLRPDEDFIQFKSGDALETYSYHRDMLVTSFKIRSFLVNLMHRKTPNQGLKGKITLET